MNYKHFIFGLILVFFQSNTKYKCPLPLQDKCLDKKYSCREQEQIMALTSKCVKEYKCKPSKQDFMSRILIGLYEGNSMKAAVFFDKTKKELLPAKAEFFAGLNQVYFPLNSKKISLNKSVSYDGVESERCYWSFTSNDISLNPKLKFVFSESSKDLNHQVRKPNPKEQSLFYKNHKPTCRDDTCSDGPKVDGFFAVSDLDKDGLQEFWYFYINGYRYWYKAEEYNPKKNKWRNFFSF